MPTIDQLGNPTTTTVDFTASAGYAAGLSAIAPPPAGSYWVGYVSDVNAYATSSGPQSIALSPTFTLPDGFVGPFTWRTVVGYRSTYFKNQDVTCPGAFPGAQTPIVGQTSLCVDFPDAGTINGPPSALATGSLSIVPPATVSVAAGGTASMTFAALFAGDNPSAGVFGATVATTLPGVMPAIAPAQFAPTPTRRPTSASRSRCPRRRRPAPTTWA